MGLAQIFHATLLYFIIIYYSIILYLLMETLEYLLLQSKTGIQQTKIYIGAIISPVKDTSACILSQVLTRLHQRVIHKLRRMRRQSCKYRPTCRILHPSTNNQPESYITLPSLCTCDIFAVLNLHCTSHSLRFFLVGVFYLII